MTEFLKGQYYICLLKQTHVNKKREYVDKVVR